MRTAFALVVMLGCACVTRAQRQLSTVPLSVCELLENRLKYNGQMVTVRGETDGFSEGSWLVDGSCHEPRVVSGYRRSNDIALVGSYAALNPVDFRLDLQAADRMEREYRQQMKKLKLKKREDAWIIVTYVGRFETRDDAGLNGPLTGFGHLGGSLAQLIIKTQRDLEVKPKPLQTKK